MFVDYVEKLTPLKRFSSVNIQCDKLLNRIGDIEMRTASFTDVASVVSELIFMSIIANPSIILKTTDYRGIAVLKITSLLNDEPVFSIDTSQIRFLDGYSFLDESERDVSRLDPHQTNCLYLYEQLEFCNLLQSFAKDLGRPAPHVLAFVMTEVLRLYHPNMIPRMLKNSHCFENTINQSLNNYREKLAEFESKICVTSSAKKDLVENKFLFEHVRLPFVASLRLVFSEYLDKSQSSDENFILSLVEVLGGDCNFNIALLRSNLPLLEDCKQGILMMSLLYLHNNLNYTKLGDHCANLHLGQLIAMIEERGEPPKSGRYFRPLFLRSLSRNQSKPKFGDRFDVKRPRKSSPVSSNQTGKSKSWCRTVLKTDPQGNQGRRSPVSSVTDTEGDGISHQSASVSALCVADQNWGFPEPNISSLLVVEADAMTIGDEMNASMDQGIEAIETID